MEDFKKIPCIIKSINNENKKLLIPLLCIIFEQYEKQIIEKTDKFDSEEFEVNEILSELKKINISIEIFIWVIEKALIKYKSITISVEMKYIDKIFRDSYYSHFGELHTEISRYCKRVVLFKDAIENNIKSCDKNILIKNFIGSIVITPLNTENCIGRSLINPLILYPDNEEIYVRLALYNINYLGINLQIQAFPFLMQDKVTTTCAEVTLLIICDYYSNKYNNYNFIVPSDISTIVRENSYFRVIPTTGLSYQMISKVLCSFGFSCDFYLKNTNITTSEIKRVISYYIESGIPVALGIYPKKQVYPTELSKGHSIVCIGHGKLNVEDISSRKLSEIYSKKDKCIINTVDLCDEYVVIDDLQKPYSKYTYDKNFNLLINPNGEKCCINHFVVPLYKRMYMDAKKAEETVYGILNSSNKNQFNLSKYYEQAFNLKIGNLENPIIIRLFMASSRHFKEFRLENCKNELLKNVYKNIPLPQFVWVCELYDKEGYCNNLMAFGEIVIDATYSLNNLLDSVLMINYPQYLMAIDNSRQNLFDSINYFISYNEIRFIKGYNRNLKSLNMLKNDNDNDNNNKPLF